MSDDSSLRLGGTISFRDNEAGANGGETGDLGYDVEF